LRRICSSTFY